MKIRNTPNFTPVAQPSSRASSLQRRVKLLKQTRRWVLLVGSTYLITGGSVILGLIVLQLADPGGAEGWRPIVGKIVLGGVILMAVGITCVQLGSRIREYVRHQTDEGLERTLEAQLRYWQLTGFLILVILVVLAAFVAVVVLGWRPG